MNEMMNWFSHYNTLIIQIVFSVLLLLIAIYMYRLFFVSSGSDSFSEGSAELSEVNKKLNQLLQQQQVKAGATEALASVPGPASVDSSPRPATEANSISVGPSAEVEQLKAEINSLRTQLNESEKKVFEMTPTISEDGSPKASPSSTEAAFGVGPTSSASHEAQVEELNKKIEQLESRLSEYDIIAEDIAELSQLKAENAEFKRRLKDLPLAETVRPADPPTTASAATDLNVALEELAGGDPVAETEAVAVQSALTEDPAVPEEVSAIDDLILDALIPDTDKNLMNDFEKSTQKG